MTNKNDMKMYSVKNILSNDNYVIPMYQRNYAWKDKEILQLVEDVCDYCKKSADNYYIGSLVVFKQPTTGDYEVIDGQQRLSTLSLLAMFLDTLTDSDSDLKNQPTIYHSNLHFECRENANNTLAQLATLSDIKNIHSLTGKINHDIANGYQIIAKNLTQTVANRDVKLKDFVNFLLEKVKILRIEVPADTDLNHYFEVMNNRGEQLEKHEIIKAKLLEVFNGEDKNGKESKHIFNLIWEACADIDSYLQSGFSTSERSHVFGETWDNLRVSDFASLTSAIQKANNQTADNETLGSNSLDNDSAKALSIDEILDKPNTNEPSQNNNDKSDRFHALVNFPNFLMQVLRVSTGQDISLDDKTLIDSFEEYLLNDEIKAVNYQRLSKVDRVKKFAFELLRCKFLFDNFIIKREYANNHAKEGKWSLQSTKKQATQNSLTYANTFSDINLQNQLTMLLASFHVSVPTLSYKHWLNGALNWLFKQHKKASDNITAEAYLGFLENMACQFMFNRYVSTNKADYYQMLYQDKVIELSKLLENINLKLLRYGEIRNTFVFNYLDYLIWKTYKGEDSNINGFEFSARSSIEHFYAQTPDFYTALNDDYLHSFGNLFLLSHGYNSSLSNKPPLEKKANFLSNYVQQTNKNTKNTASKAIPTLKLYMLVNKTLNEKDDDEILNNYSNLMKEHEEEMIGLLLNYENLDFC